MPPRRTRLSSSAGRTFLSPFQLLSRLYCGWETKVFNNFLFCLGRRYARIFRFWFSFGVGFGFLAFIISFLILIWQFGWLVIPSNQKNIMPTLPKDSRPLITLVVPGLNVPWSNLGYILVGAVTAVGFHEFGHALAAASFLALRKAFAGFLLMIYSEGVQIEHIAIFLACLFPGALVALDYETLRLLSPVRALRIYCAGIWHNAVLCAGCCLLMMFLPVVLHPFYLHSKNLVVAALPYESLLGKHIRPGNVILGVGGLNPESPEDWVSNLQHLSSQDSLGYDTGKDYVIAGNTSTVSDFSGVNTNQGFCVPSENIEDKQQRAIGINCSDGELSFLKMVCLNVTNYEGKEVGASNNGSQAVLHGSGDEYCVKARDVIQYSSCDQRQTQSGLTKSCTCSENKFCMLPRLQQGERLVEVTFMDPNSRRCSSGSKEEIRGSLSQMHTEVIDHFGTENCQQSLFFAGDPLALAFSLQLTNYHPRRMSFFGLWSISAPLWFPGMLESLIAYTFYISSAVALLNSAPVFYLDGEVILQTCLSCCTPFLHPRRQRQVLHTFLLVGTALFALAFVSGFINLLA